jgi:DNA-directed RNA polymerase subunit RPC12/RpoP
MSQVDVECVQCGSNEYRIVDERIGEVMCPYCRNKWIVPAIAQRTTELPIIITVTKDIRETIINKTSDSDTTNKASAPDKTNKAPASTDSDKASGSTDSDKSCIGCLAIIIVVICLFASLAKLLGG